MFKIWVRYFVWNLKWYLWYSTQNVLPTHSQMCNMLRSENLRAPRFISPWAFFKCPPELRKRAFTGKLLVVCCADFGENQLLQQDHTVDSYLLNHCPACRTYLIATRFWVVVICPIIKCLTVLEFSFILFDLCLFITIFNFILNYVPIVTFWIFTYHKIWILLIIFCFIWNYWIIYLLTCLEVFWSVVS